MGCLDPVCLELLITDAIEKHFVFSLSVRHALTLDHFQITFMIGDLFSDLSVESGVKFCEGKFALS